MYALETEKLSKSYGRFKALDGLDVHVPQGAIYGLEVKTARGKPRLSA